MVYPATNPYRLGSLSFLLALAAMMWMPSAAQAQTIIEPGPPGTLNDAILSDTTATGERNTCQYLLRRDAVYIYNREMELRDRLGDCTFVIEAEEGDGARPIIKPAALQGGEESPRPFRVYTRGGLTVRGLYFDSYDTTVPEPGIPGDNATIRVSVDGARVIIDDSRFDRNRQSTMRTGNDSTKWYITNSVFSNNYNDTRRDQSFIFDTRGNIIDSLVFINNTIYNHAGHIARNADEARIGYFKFDHNTFVNVGGIPEGNRVDTLRAELPGEQDFGTINFGQTRFAVFRNNLMVNASFIGRETDDALTPKYVVDIDSTVVDSVTIVAPAGVDIRNNVISFDASLAGVYPDTVEVYSEEDLYDPTLDLFIAEQGSASTLLATNVELTDAPDAPLDFITAFYEQVGGQADNTALLLPRDSRYVSGPDVEGDLDFSYATSSAAFAAAVDGMPAGDLNAFNLADTYTSGPDQFVMIGTANEEVADVPDGFRLHGNFPNPFNPSTTIRFDLDAPAHVAVTVYDLLGRKVMALPAQPFVSGSGHAVRLEASTLASGVYFYRVEAQGAVQTQMKTGRMVLLK